MKIYNPSKPFVVIDGAAIHIGAVIVMAANNEIRRQCDYIQPRENFWSPRVSAILAQVEEPVR